MTSKRRLDNEKDRLVKIIEELISVKKSLSLQKDHSWYKIRDYISDMTSIDDTIRILQEQCRKNNGVVRQ